MISLKKSPGEIFTLNEIEQVQQPSAKYVFVLVQIFTLLCACIVGIE